ncbi:MAG TPA: aminoglycoside phosphotransferase family protein [Gaiellaceae bacterium]
MSVPESLGWWRGRPGGADWLDRLPGIVEACAARWSLDVGRPFGGHISWVAPARLPDGRHAVLKVNFPEAESEHEADALGLWDGSGAVRLLESDSDLRALLVERCAPGTTLWEIADEDEANRIAAGVLRLLWRPAPAQHPFRLLADEAARWADELPARWERAGRPCGRWLLDEAVTFLQAAGPEQGEPVVVHQDFHGGNVLRADREPWLAIDPKPLVGERELDVASLLRDRRGELARDPAPARRVRRRLDLLAAELGLDRERMRGWGVAHALAWGLDDDGHDEAILACATWLRTA